MRPHAAVVCSDAAQLRLALGEPAGSLRRRHSLSVEASLRSLLSRHHPERLHGESLGDASRYLIGRSLDLRELVTHALELVTHPI